MATVDVWIQIENHAWDASPSGLDRMTGQTPQQLKSIVPMSVSLKSPVSGVMRPNVTMFQPVRGEALLLRRYTPDWAAPDDHKVNPWDLNERDPTDTGTMGTIPGAVIECNVGDEVLVHFRNMDTRTGVPPQGRAHSLHPHGFVFANTFDGAYPLSPPDPAQPIGPEAPLWAALGVTEFKKGDRVPAGGTFTYTWQTLGWPTTAGVWLYHDHSICDMDNVTAGAIGLVVIHNVGNDPEDFLISADDLPGGSFVGSPSHLHCFPFDRPMLPAQLDHLGELAPMLMPPAHMSATASALGGGTGPSATASDPHAGTGPPDPARTVTHGNMHFELDPGLTQIQRFCLPFYRTPPAREQCLLLFHNLPGVGMCINGRQWLGNTPTVVAGPQTLLRFGVVGMGNSDSFHTFHIHGHRWIIPGPSGTNRAAIQQSAQLSPVSQFEDTRTFGPANSFFFMMKEGTIDGQPSFMGPPPGAAVGEWHMHCHVLNHMMEGMMGSLLIVNGEEFVAALPVGEPCPPSGGTLPANTVQIKDLSYDPANLMVNAGQTVTWTNTDSDHTVTSNPGPLLCTPPSTEVFQSAVLNLNGTFAHTFNTPGTFAYHCEIHGCAMSGTITVM